jgi:hypothetical protein
MRAFVLIITHLKLLFTYCSSLPVCLEKGQVKNKAIHLTSEERNQLWCRCKERISRHSRLTNSRSFANVNSQSLSVSSSGKSGTTSPVHQMETPCTFQSIKWHKLHAHIQQNCKYWKKVSDMEPPWSSWSYSCVNLLLNSQMHQKCRCCVWTLNSRKELDEGRNIPDAPAALTAFMKTSGPCFRIGL